MDENNLTPWGAMVNAVKDGREEGSSNTTEPSAADVAGPTPVLQQQITPEMVAAGYQPGMTAQQITIGDEGKGPKVPMIIASILVVIGLVGFGIGAVVGASIEDTFTNLSTVEYTTQIGVNGTIIHDDADRAGEEGWYLLIPGDPELDENENNRADACEGIQFNITVEGEPAAMSDGQGNRINKEVARFSCSMTSGNSDEYYFDIEDHIVIARICYTSPSTQDDDGIESGEHDCDIGLEINIENDNGINMSVVDLDAMYIKSGFVEEVLTKGGVSAGSFGAGCCSVCGGFIALIIGLTRLGGKKTAQQFQYQIQ